MTTVKQLFLLTLVMHLGQFCFGQEPAYRWGEPATNDYLERRIDKLLVLDQEGFVLLRKYTNETFTSFYWIESYSPDLKLQSSVPIEFNGGVMGDSYDIEDILVANGKIFAFISNWNKSAGKHTFSVSQLSLSGELKHIKDLDIIPAKKMGNRGFFNFILSENQQKLLLLSEQPFVKKTMEKMRLTCFNTDDFSIDWTYDHEYAIESSKALHHDIVVDDSGHALVYKKTYEKGWYYSLYSYSADAKWQEYQVEGLDGLSVLDHRMGTNINGEFYLFATYTKKESSFKKHLDGYWYFALDKSLKQKTQVRSTWNADLLAGYLLFRKSVDDPEEEKLQDFYIKDVLARKDGNLLILMEQLVTKNSTIEGTSPTQYLYERYYDDLLVLNLDASSGKTIWWQCFEKDQDLRNKYEVDEYGSFVYHFKEDRLFILWSNPRLSMPSIPPAGWTEPDGTKYVKKKAFDEKTAYASFLRIVEPNGDLAYPDRKYGLPLLNLHRGAVFEMSLTTPFFFSLEGDLVVLATMNNGGKRYRFGFVDL